MVCSAIFTHRDACVKSPDCQDRKLRSFQLMGHFPWSIATESSCTTVSDWNLCHVSCRYVWSRTQKKSWHAQTKQTYPSSGLRRGVNPQNYTVLWIKDLHTNAICDGREALLRFRPSDTISEKLLVLDRLNSKCRVIEPTHNTRCQNKTASLSQIPLPLAYEDSCMPDTIGPSLDSYALCRKYSSR